MLADERPSTTNRLLPVVQCDRILIIIFTIFMFGYLIGFCSGLKIIKYQHISKPFTLCATFMKQSIIYIILIAAITIGCNSNSKGETKVKSKTPQLTGSNAEYFIFGQYSNNNNSRWKQFYRISHDSIFMHFQGGSYYNYMQQKWIEKIESNVSNQLLTDVDSHKVLSLLKGIESQFLSVRDSILGNAKNMDEQAMYVEIGNRDIKRYWKINELDTSLAGNIKALDRKLNEAIQLLDPENDE
jgi:hypothetical protein